jgi:hypothetical protein
MTLHQKFILLARNRSEFLKIRSEKKYKIREKFDDNVRYALKCHIIRSKPSIGKKSIALANKLRREFGDKNMKLVDIRHRSR